MAQPVLTAAGRIQASSVIRSVKWSRALSSTVTQALMPLNDRALPYFPAAVQVALARVPFNPLPDPSGRGRPGPLLEPPGPDQARSGPCC